MLSKSRFLYTSMVSSRNPENPSPVRGGAQDPPQVSCLQVYPPTFGFPRREHSVGLAAADRQETTGVRHSETSIIPSRESRLRAHVIHAPEYKNCNATGAIDPTRSRGKLRPRTHPPKRRKSPDSASELSPPARCSAFQFSLQATHCENGPEQLHFAVSAPEPYRPTAPLSPLAVTPIQPVLPRHGAPGRKGLLPGSATGLPSPARRHQPDNLLEALTGPAAIWSGAAASHLHHTGVLQVLSTLEIPRLAGGRSVCLNGVNPRSETGRGRKSSPGRAGRVLRPAACWCSTRNISNRDLEHRP